MIFTEYPQSRLDHDIITIQKWGEQQSPVPLHREGRESRGPAVDDKFRFDQGDPAQETLLARPHPKDGAGTTSQDSG